MTTEKPDIIVSLYKGHKNYRQAWRWRALSPNNRKLATSGEAYTNEADALKAIYKLFGHESNVVLRHPTNDESVLRTASAP